LAVRRLRIKIEADPSHPQRVVTVRGVGYKYVPQPDLTTVNRGLGAD
jgi:DNA-binding response OmpR family regulator